MRFSFIVVRPAHENSCVKAWFLAYLIVVIVSGILHPNLGSDTELPIQAGILVFVLTVVPFSAVVFAIPNYFVKQKDLLIDAAQAR